MRARDDLFFNKHSYIGYNYNVSIFTVLKQVRTEWRKNQCYA